MSNVTHLHRIHTGTSRGYVWLRPGMRVNTWHQTYVNEADPVPGTVVSFGKEMATVDFDDHGPRRVSIRNLHYWGYPREKS